MSDAFGHILLHPDTALSCQIFLYKSTEDSKPTLDLTKAVVNENNEPILFPLVYSHSSFDTKDLPMIFGYAMTQCVRFFKEYSLPFTFGETLTLTRRDTPPPNYQSLTMPEGGNPVDPL